MKWIRKIVVPQIAPHWEDVANELEIPYTAKETFKLDNNRDTKRCCCDMLEKWLNTDIGVSPKTWDTLLKALSEVDNLTRATEEIKEHLKQCCEICSFD